ncbi:thymidine kinase [Gammaproteobacteria bacterium]|nr:thymidine kinase [Gammaproteobacteria bacterium]
MAKVHFFYSTMNAGKSTALLQSNYNYHERGMETLLFLPKIDADSNDGKIHSRIGLTAGAHSVDLDFNFFNFVSQEKIKKNISCILIDEVQFLTKDQVRQVCKVSDELNIPAMCYGIRTDFQGKLFEGSAELLALADNLIELKTVCDCGRKAIMVVRLDEKGKVVKDGDQIKIGGNDSYKVFCRKHFRELTQLI